LKALLGDHKNLDEAEQEAQNMAKSFYEAKRDCNYLQEFWQEHEGHWVLEHIETHIEERDSQVLWNPMPKWLIEKISCDSDASDGCGAVPLMYYPVAYEGDYLHDIGVYSFEISNEGTHPKTHLDAAKECAELCVNDVHCMGGDVVVKEKDGENPALSCNLFSRPQAVMVSNNVRDFEGFYDRGFIKKSFWDRNGDMIKFTRGWTLCEWNDDSCKGEQ
jgi:hypothetical protein